MPGNFTLGCLLGAYDKAQSFDVASVNNPSEINSWVLGAPVTVASYTNKTAVGCLHVHSSGQGIRIRANSYSGVTSVLQYSYGVPEDAHKRWFPDITTHDIRMDAWFTMDTAAQSGRGTYELQAGPSVLLSMPYITDGEIEHHRIITTVFSNGVRPRALFRTFGNVGYEFYIDDVVTQIDPIDIFPEYSFQDQQRIIKNQNRTIGGKLHTYTWGQYFQYTVPLQFLSDSHANLINWWWQNQFNLAFTLDTSDSESMFICRIINDRKPIGQRVRPYQDRWAGVLHLESIDEGSLVF